MDDHDILTRFPISDPVLLKKGGQKAAYSVVHATYGRAVIKIGNYKYPESLERAKREVLVQREIESQYYPKNHDFQVVVPGVFVIIEEYIESEALSNCMGEFSSLPKIIPMVANLVAGLKIIWDKNIVHRDIKPDNILIGTDGIPRIIDLGIARLLDQESLTHSLAARGPCTPIYAAPEQLSNRKTEIDSRTDQFAIGILMMQLLLKGVHPFDPSLVGGTSIVENIIAGTWYAKALEVPHLLPVKNLVNRLLGPEPFQRYRRSDTLL